MVKTILSVFTLKTSMNKILLISAFSILTLNIMAQEKIIQTAGDRKSTRLNSSHIL